MGKGEGGEVEGGREIERFVCVGEGAHQRCQNRATRPSGEGPFRVRLGCHRRLELLVRRDRVQLVGEPFCEAAGETGPARYDDPVPERLRKRQPWGSSRADGPGAGMQAMRHIIPNRYRPILATRDFFGGRQGRRMDGQQSWHPGGWWC